MESHHAMIKKMFLKALATVALLAATLLCGCGTSSPGPGGSRNQTMTGVSDNGYPPPAPGQPEERHSASLSSSSESLHSKQGAPKVPEVEEKEAGKTEKPKAK